MNINFTQKEKSKQTVLLAWQGKIQQAQIVQSESWVKRTANWLTGSPQRAVLRLSTGEEIECQSFQAARG